jgi:energy-coupling factor transporter ATP-binding protein EcfA2
MTSPLLDPPLRGLRNLTIRDFRGWREGQEIDTDADIVLLTGANGCGKTSLLEAVNLLVNGHCFDLRGRSGSQEQRLENLIHRGRKGFSVGAVARESGTRLAVRFDLGAKALVRDDPYWLEIVNGAGKNPPPPDLLASATTYFQDRIDSILRDLDRSTTLRDWLVPLPPEVEVLRRRVEERALELQREAAEAELRLEEARAPSPEFCTGAQLFRELWEELRSNAPSLSLPEAPAQIHLHLDDFAADLATWRAIGNERPADEIGYFGRLLTRCIDDIEVRMAYKLGQPGRSAEHDPTADEREDLATRLAELERTHPAKLTERVVEQFSGAGRPALLAVLRSVESQLPRWRDLPRDLPDRQLLEPLLAELGRLDVGAAGVLRAVLERWLSPWEEAHAKRLLLQEMLARSARARVRPSSAPDIAVLKAAIDAWRRTWDGEISRRREIREADRIRADAAARRQMAEVLRIEASGNGALATLQPLNDEVKRDLATALDGTLVRFHFDTGFLPVRPREESCPARDGSEIQGYELLTRDERPSYVLSTGQRGQLALAYMLAPGLLLRTELPHRVLLLDDTSTAFDLGNIIRQATWLRQLAYGPREGRWQIFLASHHEELTVRLIELLVPPAHRELRLIRFLGWTPENGPRIEPARRARQNPSLTQEARRNLARRLSQVWETVPAERVEQDD